MSLDELRAQIIDFRDKRDWEQFHHIKDLISGLSIEVSELAELFLWKDEKQIQEINPTSIKEEVADIFILLNYICAHYDIDLIEATQNKLKKNHQKYPIEKSFGSNKKYTELS